jgi:hypothetical protein
MKILYITIILAFLSTILHSQNCEQKDYSRQNWIEKDTVLSVLSDNIEPNAVYSENSIIKIKNDNIKIGMYYNIYDIKGSIIIKSQILKKESDYLIIDLEDLPISNGIYFISFENKQKNFVYKLINTK